MPFPERIFQTLEAELKRNIAFTFSIVRNVTRPQSRKIRPNDWFVFTVSVRNNSGLTMKNVRGAIRPTELAEFKAAPFKVASLGAYRQVEIAEIEARILGPYDAGSPFEQMATVNVMGQVDVSEFWFRDANRPITHLDRPQAIPTAPRPRPRTRPTTPPPPRVETRKAARKGWLELFGASGRLKSATSES